MTTSPQQNSIVIKDLQIGYRKGLHKASTVFGPMNAEIRHAEMVGIIGPNGVGKSTLLRTIAGIQPSLKGHVLIHNVPCNRMSLKEMATTVSFVSTESVQAQAIRVQELIAMGRFPYTGWLGELSLHDREVIHHAAERTGVMQHLTKPLHELSDGERQKVMIARALAQDTPIIILDEPTAFLDLPARYEILSILRDLTLDHNKTILFSTHDLSVAMEVADKLWLMADQEIFQGAPEDLVINKVFRKLFLNSTAEFDEKTSTFRFKRNLKETVLIQGEKYRLITKKAMERIGFLTVENETETERIITVSEHEGVPLWKHTYHRISDSFSSLYNLTTFIKTNS